MVMAENPRNVSNKTPNSSRKNNKHSEKPNHKHSEKPNHKHSEKPNHKHSEKPNHKHSEKPNHKHSEKPNHKHSEKPNHKHSEKPKNKAKKNIALPQENDITVLNPDILCQIRREDNIKFQDPPNSENGDRVKHEVSLDAKQKDDCNGSTNCERRSAQLKDNSTFNTDVLSSIKKEQDSFRYPLISEQGISQPPNKRGRPALTPQLRLIRRKETNKMAHDQRINIGSAFDDWMAVKNEKCLIRHEQVAMHLIDTYRQFMTLCEETVCAELGVEGSEALGSPSFDEYVPGPSQFCMTVSPKEMWMCPSDSYIAAPFTGTSRNSDDSEEEFELCENQN